MKLQVIIFIAMYIYVLVYATGQHYKKRTRKSEQHLYGNDNSNQDDSPQFRIAGGDEAEEGQFPYIVAFIQGSTFEREHFCTGAIFKDNWVVTTAYCIVRMKDPEKVTILAGTNKIMCEKHPGDSYKVDRAVPHQGYLSYNHTNDIGLVKIVGKIKFNEKVKPIKLSTDFIDGGFDVVLSSWGSVGESDYGGHTLRFAHLKTIDLFSCKDWSTHEEVGVYTWNICTQSKEGKGACHGDRGAPLVYNGELVGLVSWFQPCALGKPDVYTRISYYSDWIWRIQGGDW